MVQNLENNPNVKDQLFLQEIINDLRRNGYSENGKADRLIRDWIRELKDKTGLRGKVKKVFYKIVGKQLW